ncbi:hypothetical protein ACQR16_25960 [Bradyrhizobium oligotrophicum]|uniref:hypothetical protein n=1 Tax=Bradyrhizobium oligotrophicum TaxID=44255 RepID=UPI003EB8294E
MSDYDYCKIYVEADLSYDSLKSTIARILDAPIEWRSIKSSSMSVDCYKNPFSKDGESDFISWPYYLEVEANSGFTGPGFVKDVQKLIESLKSEAMKVAPSCDFEDLLKI